MFTERLIHEYQSSFIHESQKLETIQISTNKKIAKQIVVDL